jgi:hypothetical protein
VPADRADERPAMRVRLLVLLGAVGLALLAAAAARPAPASEAVTDTNLRSVRLAVNTKGEALLTYTRSNGTVRHVLAWGAINANPPVEAGLVPQVRFSWDYAGGWGKYRNGSYWKTFRNACQPYDGPALPYLVGACKAPDGTYWAVQAWQRLLPLLGFDAWKPEQLAFETHLSHWSGPLPQLELYAHWSYGGQWQGVFGRLTYLGEPVHGFSSTSDGNPRDRYGRNVFIDTYNSAYGPGWRREAGILLHSPNGTFCHSFVPQKPFPGYPSQALRPAAPGERYRATVMGPGVTPVVSAEIAGMTAGDRQSQSSDDQVWDSVMAGDARCAPER